MFMVISGNDNDDNNGDNINNSINNEGNINNNGDNNDDVHLLSNVVIRKIMMLIARIKLPLSL